MIDRICIDSVDKHKDELIALATDIWNNPEIGWTEVNASSKTAAYLESQGFKVELGAYGIPTAIRAVWGKGYPTIGFAGEYDCLPGLSQKVSSHKDPVVEGGLGHGCGHNLLGVGCVAACVAIKEELEASGKEGTVIYYGCPAEEQLTGKGFMAKGGAFKECDIMVAWHPGSSNVNSYGSMNGVEVLVVKFHGKTAHAAMNPQDGRSALDALQLMNMGVEFIREHVTDDVRIHYVITSGGLAPNIVPDYAEGKYFTRALSREATVAAMDWVKECAYGAARMTGTTVEFVSEGGIYPGLQNHVLVDVMQKVREQIPLVEWTEEDLKFADEINKTSPLYTEGVPPISDAIAPVVNTNGAASSDFGDVMHIVPSVQNSECTAATLSGGHSWMVTACAGSPIGMKGMLRAAKVMAAGAMEIYDDHSIVDRAKAEFKQAMHGTEYVCPITDDVRIPFKK